MHNVVEYYIMVRFDPETQQIGLEHAEMSLAISGIERLMGFDDGAQSIIAYRESLQRKPATLHEIALHAMKGAIDEAVENDWDTHTSNKTYWLPRPIAPQISEAIEWSADHIEEHPYVGRIPGYVERSRKIATTALAQLRSHS